MCEAEGASHWAGRQAGRLSLQSRHIDLFNAIITMTMRYRCASPCAGPPPPLCSTPLCPSAPRPHILPVCSPFPAASVSPPAPKIACPFSAAHLPASSTRSRGPLDAATATPSLGSPSSECTGGGRRLELIRALPCRSSFAPLIREPTSPEELDLLLLLLEEGPATEE